MTTRAAQLRRLLKEGGPGIVPGATDCFTATLIEQAGFPVLYVTGTNARAPEGFEPALDRARKYLELGADAIFVEQPRSVEELRRIGEEFRGTPLVANMVERSKTPLVPEPELRAIGFNIILYANAALYLGSYAIKQGQPAWKPPGTAPNVVNHRIGRSQWRRSKRQRHAGRKRKSWCWCHSR